MTAEIQKKIDAFFLEAIRDQERLQRILDCLNQDERDELTDILNGGDAEAKRICSPRPTEREAML